MQDGNTLLPYAKDEELIRINEAVIFQVKIYDRKNLVIKANEIMKLNKNFEEKNLHKYI